MENATKALLIAGSVLIAILLIAMGLRIFNSTSETTEQSQKAMETTAIATFNSQFTGYLNKPLSESQVSTLVQKCIASNAVNPQHPVVINGNKPEEAVIASGIYKCLTGNDGYIWQIYIDKNM